jgi:hypothetical protein
MSYLSEPTSKLGYGVVRIGDYIEVDDDGIISLLQDVGPTADVVFNSIDVDNLTVDGANVVTSVTPTAGYGIEVTNLIATGYDVTFDIANTGVVELIAGTGISLSGATGSITISSVGADLINVYGTTTSYTATADDEYIGVNSSAPVTITLPVNPAQGRVYIIKDELGQGSGKITIQPPAGTLIDTKVNYIIGTPYQSVQMVYRASGWWII